ncbi:MAG TPA: hypothetical protein VK510_03955, partial [Solirubrobacteraceae bacterium]|nr:hypothetical protein [Solirubrobacteraceae bacterium]
MPFDMHGLAFVVIGSAVGLPASEALTALARHCHAGAACAALASAAVIASAETVAQSPIERLISSPYDLSGADPLRRLSYALYPTAIYANVTPTNGVMRAVAVQVQA